MVGAPQRTEAGYAGAAGGGLTMDVASMSTEELDCRLHQLLADDVPDDDSILRVLRELERREPEPTPEEMERLRVLYAKIFR